MFTNPSAKYRPFPAVDLADRQWPGKTITHAADLDEHRPARR